MRWRIAMLVLIAVAGVWSWQAFAPGPEQARVAPPKTVSTKAKNATLTPEERRQKYVHEAARRIVELEETQPDMGSAHLQERYAQLLQQEAPLRLEYEAIKADRAKARKLK